MWMIALVLLAQGAAIGLGQQAPVIGVQMSAPRRDTGAATGSVTLMRMGGAAMAIALYGALLTAGLDPAAQDVAGAYSDAFTAVYLGAAVIAVIGLIAALMLRPAIMPQTDQARAPAER